MKQGTEYFGEYAGAVVAMNNATAKHTCLANFLIYVKRVGIARNLCVKVNLSLGVGKIVGKNISDLNHKNSFRGYKRVIKLNI